MAGAIEWQLRLIDRLSGPASGMQRRLDAIERTIKRVESVTRVSGGAFGGWAQQGEAAARRVQRAYDLVGRSMQQLHQHTQNITNTLRNGLLAGGALAVGIGYAGKQVVDAAAYKQDQLISLKGMLGGSSARASKLFSDAQRFAAATPFSTKDVIDAARQAVAIGYTDRQAIPLVKLAGSLSAGSGKSMDMVMEAFAALKGGDFSQAFGVGQGFSNLNISREMLRKAGLKFDAQGSYKGTSAEGLAAVRKIVEQTYGTAMDDRSRSLSGLASNLASRPQELFMSLVDDNGSSKAMKPLQDFMSNLNDLSDFSKPPGSRIQARFASSMEGLMKAVFGPLADATGGTRGEKLINSLLDKVDQFSAWWAKNGPGVVANVKGFGEGLKFVADSVSFLIKPFEWLFKMLDRMSGGTGEGGLIGKLLGGAAGLAILNKLTGGLLGLAAGKLLGNALGGKKSKGEDGEASEEGGGSGLSGKLGVAKTVADMLGLKGASSVLDQVGGFLGSDAGGLATSAWERFSPQLGERYGAGMTRFRRLRATGQGFGSAARGALSFAGRGMVPPALAARAAPLLARLGPLVGMLSNPIGLTVGVVAAAGAGLVLAYKNIKPFREFVDGLGDKFRAAGHGALDFGKRMLTSLADLWDRLPQPARLILGTLIPGLGIGAAAGRAVRASDPTYVAPVPGLGTGPNASINALTGVAQRLGIDPQTLLAVAYKESSLNAGAVNSISGASGLIQFLPKTARGLGTTAEAIRAMTPEQQAPYIERYLRQAGVTSGMGLEQVYAAVFSGHASKAGGVLYRESDGRAYSDNKGLDLDGNGEITSAEAANAALQAWEKNRGSFAPTLVQNFNGPLTPGALAGAQQSASQQIQNWAVEHGHGAPQ